jgi:ABC-2 type transport system ATP-binding protein
MIRSGRILFCDSLDRIKETHARVTLEFADPQPTPPSLNGALAWDGGGREWTAVCAGRVEQFRASATAIGARVVQQSPVSLDEIFIARSIAKNAATQVEN